VFFPTKSTMHMQTNELHKNLIIHI
jgi:hypothetical protein